MQAGFKYKWAKQTMILEVNSLELHTAWIIRVELKTIILPVGIIHGDFEILTLFDAE